MCNPPKTWLGRMWLKIRIYFEHDDGESLTCPKCGEKYYVD